MPVDPEKEGVRVVAVLLLLLFLTLGGGGIREKKDCIMSFEEFSTPGGGEWSNFIVETFLDLFPFNLGFEDAEETPIKDSSALFLQLVCFFSPLFSSLLSSRSLSKNIGCYYYILLLSLFPNP